jgi:hypothetical protein
MAAVSQFVWGFQRLLFLNLGFVQLFINGFDIGVNILVDEFHDGEELLNSVANVVLEVVEHDGERDHIVNVHLLSLIVSFQVDEQVVFGCQLPMTFHVVHQLLQAVLGDHVVLDASGRWLPLEVVQTVIMVICWLPTRGQYYIFVLGVVSGLETPALLQHRQDEPRVVAWTQHVLERGVLILLESVFGDVGVLGQSVLASLDEPFLLLGSRLEWVGQPPGREVTRLLGLFNGWLLGLWGGGRVR